VKNISKVVVLILKDKTWGQRFPNKKFAILATGKGRDRGLEKKKGGSGKRRIIRRCCAARGQVSRLREGIQLEWERGGFSSIGALQARRQINTS